MTYENIQIQHGNFTIDRSGSAFYTVDHENVKLIKKDSSGNVIFSFFLATLVLEVQSLQFDGYYFWTLEKQGTSGFRVRKWEIGLDDLVRVVDEHSFISGAVNQYDVNALAVEFYSDTLDNIETAGTTTFDVVDGSVIRVGDEIVVGPSTAVGFEGLYSQTIVINKVGDYTVTVSPALDVTFNPNDEIYFTRSFFVFSDTGPAGQDGALYKFRHNDGFFLSLNSGNVFAGVRATTFFSGKLLFVRAGEVIWLNPDSQNIYRSQAIDNSNESRGEYHTTFDLAGHSNTLYRLEQQHVYYDDTWKTETWTPVYNYNESGIIPEVYFVAAKAEPPLLHKYEASVDSEDLESDITVTVLDQFRTPLYKRGVDLISDGGSLSSVQEITDENGQIRAVYTANSSVGEVTVTVKVT